MASLEFINFEPWREAVEGGGGSWERDKLARSFDLLPQIFWESGEGWAEANHWALEKISNQSVVPETIKALMKHLHAYASFLEEHELDWRHFPIRVADRAIVQFRGELMGQLARGSLASSTARARMSAVVQFYRHASFHDFINPKSLMWQEKSVVIAFYDAVGFKRSMARVTTDLTIPNRTRPDTALEEGLFPLSETHMIELLKFMAENSTQELQLMLTIGFFTGARLGTITTLHIEDLDQARPDPSMKGFYLVRIGPGTEVETKLSVAGYLLVPDFLLDSLKRYAFSTERLKREMRAKPKDRSIIFLTKRGNRYGSNSISRLMTDLRRNAVRSDMKFMMRFKFHQTRATYGTWLMKLVLGVTTVSTAIEFVKNAMLHKHESTTFRYVKFLEMSKGKQEAAEAFNKAFTGLKMRNWDQFDA